MPHPPDGFRDFGILPEGLPPPPERIRSFLSRGPIIGQYIGTALGTALGLGLAVLFGLFLPLPLNLLGAVATLTGFAALLYLVTHNDYRWVELDGQTLRAQHLYTGRVIERRLEEIECLATMVYQVRRTETRVIETLLGRVKGIEIRFRDRRTPLRVLRADPAMTNAKELIEAIVYRMGQVRAVDAVIVDFAGARLVRQIHWRGETPSAPPGKILKVCLACAIFFAVMFGPILGLTGAQQNRLWVLGSVPPHEITLEALIENGPGANPHVIVTDFHFGGYVVESKGTSGPWSNIWIALFPTAENAGPPGKELTEPTPIKAIVESKTIRSDAELAQFARRDRVVGICTAVPRTTFGTTLGPKLIQANGGSPLVAAYVIDELSEVPSENTIWALLFGSAACFVLTILLALVVFRLK